LVLIQPPSRGDPVEENRPLVLIVEDNVLIAMEVEFMAEDCGCAVAGPAGDVAEALGIAADAALTGAVLDINLGSERVWPVAEFLDARSIPFVLASGYGGDEVPDRFKTRLILSKPISRGTLANALREAGIVP
jgi:CheY-like chemotaxis protein